MANKHVAFILESEPGHINPTLGIALALVLHGYRVSYAIKERFASRVIANGAEAFIYKPLDYRDRFLSKTQDVRSVDINDIRGKSKEFVRDEIENALPQLEEIYRNDKPDLVIYDCRNLAGKLLALRWGIPKIEHSPITIGNKERDFIFHEYDENLVIVSIPKFFQRDAHSLDDRFHFIGPLYSERIFSDSQRFESGSERAILVSQTTMGEPSVDFFKMIIHAFQSFSSRIILSIGEKIIPETLGVIPAHFEVNQFVPNFEVLKHSKLFIGHGGLMSTLEALYRGVPLLQIPAYLPGWIYDCIALRVAELGLGVRLPSSEASAENLRSAAMFILNDSEIRRRVGEAQMLMRKNNNPEIVVDLIDRYIS